MIQRRRRANRRLTGNLQAWTDRTSYFSSGGGAGARGEREVEAGGVPFREMGDKDQDGGPWALGEKQAYEEPMLTGVGAGMAAYTAQPGQQAYQPEYQQQTQAHAYQPYANHQPYALPQTPTHQSQPQGFPYTPTPGTATSHTPGETFSPAPATSQEVAAGPVLQDGMSVVVRQGFVRTLDDELGMLVILGPPDFILTRLHQSLLPVITLPSFRPTMTAGVSVNPPSMNKASCLKAAWSRFPGMLRAERLPFRCQRLQ